MYEDEDPWPITCLGCGKQFRKQIGWLKANKTVRYPDCRLLHKYSSKEFGLKVTELRNNRYDLDREIRRAKPISELPEGLDE